MPNSTSIDRFDLLILKQLEHDARISWVDLAAAVNLSASACQRRVKALQDSGIMTGYTTVVDPLELGLTVSAFVAVHVERQDFKLASRFREEIISKPGVLSCYLLSGTIDFMLHVVARDLKSFGTFIQQEILSLPGVKDATSSIVLEEIKSIGPVEAVS